MEVASIFFIIFMLISFTLAMLNIDDDTPNWLRVILLISIILLIFAGAIHLTHYKQGQIDALTGKVKYELKTMPDSTRIWVGKEKE